MAFDLNPVAVSAAPLLRAIETGGWVTKTELAEMAGRQRSNIARDLTIIENAGLIVQVADADAARPILLTEAGLAQLAAITRAEDPDAATGALTALLTDLEPHPLNPRKDFESDDAEDALNELRESILLRSLMQPIVVRPRPEAGKWWIVDGERRFRAIKQANWDGDWADDKPVPIVVRDVDDREHLLLSLTANLQRADMSAIEEGHAFHAAVHDFGLGTEDLANELGKSQRYVQQRIALLKLSAEDQDRMRLPRDHPDRISFKQARALTQTPRPADPADRPPPSQELSQALATHGAASLGGGEPGSSPPPAADPDFDSTLSHKEALLLVEVADKSDRDPAPEFAPEPYARVQAVPVKGEAQSLVEKNVLGFRQRGMHVFVRARVHTSGAYDWLVGLGFYGDHRADVLFEMRARVLGHDRARELAESGEYATPWLNPTGDPMQDGGEGRMPGPMDAMADYAAERRQAQTEAEPQQRELIEETADEKAARVARAEEARLDVSARDATDFLAARAADWMRERRAAGESDWLMEGPAAKPEAMACQLVQAVSVGSWAEAAALLATMVTRAGKLGTRDTLAQMPAEMIAQMVADARAGTGPKAS